MFPVIFCQRSKSIQEFCSFFRCYEHLILKVVIKLLSSSNYDKRFSAGLPKEKACSEHIFMLLCLGGLDTWFYKPQLFLQFCKLGRLKRRKRGGNWAVCKGAPWAAAVALPCSTVRDVPLLFTECINLRCKEGSYWLQIMYRGNQYKETYLYGRKWDPNLFNFSHTPLTTFALENSVLCWDLI